MNLSNLPPKGTADWFPEEFAIRKYIFDTWRRVCLSFGYQEYLTPILENADIYRAKSGEDVAGEELMIIEREDSDLAIRPEMTPSVTRLVSRIYSSAPKPIRYFSIANFYRYQKPQRGRNREFWQLNFDIFGSDSLNADSEILQMAIEIMLQLGANKEQFVVYLNDRQLIEAFVEKYLQVPSEKKKDAIRILDKFDKLSREELLSRLRTETGATIDDEDEFVGFLSRDEACMQYMINEFMLKEEGGQRLKALTEQLEALGYGDYIKYNPALVRGFDYYDGMVFEVFDLNPANKRSLFGGGRYNGLAGIFGSEAFPAVGCAPGDETTKLFLESWGLTEKIKTEQKRELYYLPLLAESLADKTTALAKELRAQGKEVEMSLEVQKLGKALDYANKRGAAFVVILGEDELAKGEYLLKDMQLGEQVAIKL